MDLCGTLLIHRATQCTERILSLMTKVVLGNTDEGGGCTRAQAEESRRAQADETAAGEQQLLAEGHQKKE